MEKSLCVGGQACGLELGGEIDPYYPRWVLQVRCRHNTHRKWKLSTYVDRRLFSLQAMQLWRHHFVGTRGERWCREVLNFEWG